jgi:hypothetical protein
VHRDVVCFVALYFILGLVRAGVMRVPFVIHVPGMDLYDPAADVTGFGVPANVIADFEPSLHVA